MTGKNKGGRPPRAPGERMQRLSIMVRGIYREALDILAREQRTSISQTLEGLLAQALRDKKVGKQPLLEVASQMSINGDDSPRGRIFRILSQPYKLPEEQYISDVWDKIDPLLTSHSFLLDDKINTELKIDLLLKMATDCYQLGSPSDFCADMFRKAMEICSTNEVSYPAEIFEHKDTNGISYIYNLTDYHDNSQDS